jgi:hypothetical protein
MKTQNKLKQSLKLLDCLRFTVKAILAGLISAGLSQQASAQSYTLSALWTNTLPGLTTVAYTAGATNLYATNAAGTQDGGNRGMTYNPVSNLVYVAYRAGGVANVPVVAYNGNTGAVVTNLAGSAGLQLDQLGCADDGVVYGTSLYTSVAAGNKIYSWANATAPIATNYVAVGGDAYVSVLAGKRVGDSLAVRGSGVNTLIIAGVQNFALWVIWSTTDGTNFTPTVLTNTTSGIFPSVQGISFFTNNTFIVKGGTGGDAYVIQYPTNFASLTSPVATTVVGHAQLTGIASGQADLSFNAGSGLLATVSQNSGSGSGVALFNAANFPTSSTLLTSTNFPAPVLNGNQTGDVALGGTGKTNLLFALTSNNGLHAYTINFTPAVIAPTITVPPVGATVYAFTNSYVFSVTATGTQPFKYQWQYNSVSNLATAANIANATNASLTNIPVTTNLAGWYNVIVSNSSGAVTSAPVQLIVQTGLTSAYVTQLWALPADNSAAYLDTGYNTRGLAYDPVTGTVIVAEHAHQDIYVLSPTNGSLLYRLTDDFSGLPKGSIFGLGQVAVSDDGVLYACNVSSYNPTNSTAVFDPGNNIDTRFSITRFSQIADPTGAGYTLSAAFTGDPGASWPGNPGVSSGDRWGDSMTIRGGGTNTEMLMGSYVTLSGGQFGTGPGTNVCIFDTADGINFTAHTISVTNAPDGFSYLGVAWGTNNTFWTKAPGYNLRQIQYDKATGIGWVIQSIASSAGLGSLQNLDGIALDTTNNILAGVQTGDVPNNLQLFEIPTLGFPPVPYYQAFFPAYNVNGNGNAATTIKFPYIFSLDANNGIIALQYSVPLVPFNLVKSYTPGGALVLTWQTVTGHSYQVQSTSTILDGPGTVWSNVGSSFTAPIPGTHSFTNTSFPINTQLYYRVKAN